MYLKFNETNHYGNLLSGRQLEDMIANTRELAAQSEKKNPRILLFGKSRAPTHYALAFHGVMGSRMAPGVYCNEHQIFGQ